MRLKTASSFDDLCLLNEQINSSSAGIFPGAFKPPHAGHYHTAKAAAMNNDILFILMSNTPRNLDQTNVSNKPERPDSDRYKSLLPGGKQNALLQHVDVQIAQCERPEIDGEAASASRLRKQIARYAAQVDDMITFRQNADSFIPASLSDEDKDAVAELFVSITDDGMIDAQEAAAIWSIYIKQLKAETGTNIEFEMVPGSPVQLTYEIVKVIDDSKSYDTANLYVGC